MNTVILLATIGSVAGLAFIVKGKHKIEFTLIDYCGATIMGAVLGTLLGLLVGRTITDMLPTRDVVSTPTALVAMRSSDGTSGSFVWGSGDVSNGTTYNFLQRMEDGSMVPGSVRANHLVHLIEDASLKNVGYWTVTKREADPTAALYAWALKTSVLTQTIRYEFRVPVGTVVQQFSVR